MIIKRWDPVAHRPYTKNFKPSEFFCRCNMCSDQIINEDIIHLAQKIRETFGKSLSINSGYRCPRYNSTLEGASKMSQHVLGRAMDIFIFGVTPLQIAQVAIVNGAMGLGIAPLFCHIDNREGVSDCKIWQYTDGKPVAASKETLQALGRI